MGWGFLAVYLVTLGLLLWFFPAWKWNAPRITEVIGAFLIPFLVSLAVYCTSLFIYSVATNFPRQLRGLAYFAIEISALLVAMGTVYTFPSLKRPPVYLTIMASILAGGLLNYLFRSKPSRAKNPAR